MPSISLKAVVLIHWFLFVWGTIFGSGPYIWCNIAVLAVGVWAIADRQSVDAIFLFMVMLIISILVDIVDLAVHFRPEQASGYYKFGGGMAIANLILKPVSIALLFQMYKDRGGEYNITFGPNAPSYDDIGNESHDNPNHGSNAYMKPPAFSGDTR
ncbi:type-1 angiotensin II receptor-associated protein-like [Clavelina lepadiformis]|uniref:Type-1 angiotensin II receptor-associated protein n=1 Tax=Clavelina lepadiformis TaxID=159417 RepID=A0ABP0GCF7_CLALP